MTPDDSTPGPFTRIRIAFMAAVAIVLAASIAVALLGDGGAPDRDARVDAADPGVADGSAADGEAGDGEAGDQADAPRVDEAAQASKRALSGADAADATLPSFDVVRVSRGGTGVIAGRAAPGDMVTILESGEQVGSVRADARGEWVMILEEPLPPGSAEFSLKARRDGQPPRASEDVVVLNVPEGDEDTGQFTPSQREGVVAVLTPKAGNGPSRVLQKPGGTGGEDLAGQLTVETVDYSDDSAPLISGRAEPGASVAIYLDNSFIGATRADDQGVWRVSGGSPPGAGRHVIRVDQVIGDGSVQLRIEQPFAAGDSVDPAKARSGVVVKEGNTLWQIARQLYGRGVRYTLIFRANSDQISDPDLIYPGQLFQLPSRGDGETGAAQGSASRAG